MPEELTTREKLADVAWQYNLCDKAVEELAESIRGLGATDMPKSARAILKRCRKKPHKENFHHFGLTDYIINAIKTGLVTTDQVIQLIVNIDGIPLSNSSLLSFWPISGMVANGI